MADDVTLEGAASASVEQPAVEQAVESTVSESTPDQAPAPQDTQEATPQPSRKWANKYESPEVLEQSYLELQSHKSRLEAELNGYRRGVQEAARPAPTKPEERTYSPAELRQIRVDLLNRHATAVAQGNTDEATKYAANINWVDDRLMDHKVSEYSTQTRRQSAEAEVQTDAQAVIQRHQNDLQPGMPLYNQAAKYHARFIEMGLPDNAVTTAAAISMAASQLGVSNKAVETQSRKDLAQNLQTQIKAAVKAGAGKSVSSAANPNYLDMSDADFAKAKAKMGLPNN